MTPKRKTTLIGLLLLLFVMNCKAQNSKYTAGIVVDRMNILYAGIPNPVTIVSSVPHTKLHIDWGGANAELSEEGYGKYLVYVSDTLASKGITISVSAELKKGKIVDLGKSYYRVKSIPLPIVFVGGNIRYGEQPKDAILANPFVAAKMGTDFNIDVRWRVLSYKVTFICDEDEPIIVEGHLFGDKVTEKIQNAPLGTIVVFSDIKIISIAGERDIEERIIITIK